jgi:outer membrane lipoprotein LolB
MSRSPSSMRRWRGAWVVPLWVLPLLLAGCVTRPAMRSPAMTADQQREHLQGLDAFAFDGRVAINGQDSSPSIKWQQRRDIASVRLTSLLGVGGIKIQFSPDRLQLETGDGVKHRDGDAEQLLARELGLVPPFASLRYWVLGVPAPGSAATELFDAGGRLQQLEQQGWLLTYRRQAEVNTAAGSLQLPALLTATRGDIGLRLVIDRWRIK